MRIDELKPHPKNRARRISKSRLKDLARSIKAYPELMRLRPIVVDKHGYILAGNKRYEALKLLGYEEVPDEWIMRVDLDEAKAEIFSLIDNDNKGTWDARQLASYNSELLDLALGKFEKEFQSLSKNLLEEIKVAKKTVKSNRNQRKQVSRDYYYTIYVNDEEEQIIKKLAKERELYEILYSHRGSI